MQISNFEGGRIRHFAENWKKLTSDKEILKIVDGLELEFEFEPYQNQIPPQTKFSQNECILLDAEIQKLLTKHVIYESCHESGEFISPIFLRPKKEGTHRMILNLKNLNQFIKYHHFKMDSLQTVLQMITKDCYMTACDMKDAYYCLFVAPQHQKYLKFQWKDKLFAFRACPNGLCMLPRVFTKLLKPVFSALRRKGFESSIYIDDSFQKSINKMLATRNVTETVKSLTELGFIIHPEKSVLVPTQTLVFLGCTLNSRDMTVSVPQEKAQRYAVTIANFLKAKSNTIRELCKIIGMLVSLFPAVQLGKLYYRQLENEKIMALRKSRGDFDSKIILSQIAKSDLQWWLDNLSISQSPISRGLPDIVIETDASTRGWGCYCKDMNVRTGGPWEGSETDNHINVLELQAAYFALKSLCTDKTGIHIQLMMDSMTAVSYIREQGGSKSLACNAIARKILDCVPIAPEGDA